MAPVRPADPASITEAVDLLLGGHLVAFPTETVYGLGADASNADAVARLFAAKGRPRFNPLISHLPDPGAVQAVAVMTPLACRLAAALWPGPLTLVLDRSADSAVAALACAGLRTIAVRVPAHPVAQQLLARVGRPVVAPSANPSGRLSPTRAGHVAQAFQDRAGAVALVLDGGPCRVGLESTVVDARAAIPVILRPGGLPAGVIAEAAGADPVPSQLSPADDLSAPASPGRLASHYAPRRPLRTDATAARADEALLGFGGTPAADLDLSPAGDLIEAAANLFAHLHALDRPPFSAIAVAPVPETGLGVAINDRLRRAATPPDQ